MRTSIYEILKQRILVLDGAMGTMLQRNQFEEADFRGERFKDFPHPLNAFARCGKNHDAIVNR